MDITPVPCAVCGVVPRFTGSQRMEVRFTELLYVAFFEHHGEHTASRCPIQNPDGYADTPEAAKANCIRSWNRAQTEANELIANRDKIQGQIRAADLNGWA